MSHVCGETGGPYGKCRTSAVVLTKKKSPLLLRVCIDREVHAMSFVTPPFSLFEKKVLVAPAPLTILTKHTVKPQCRCWCDFCPTSPVALLEISETLLFLS